MYNINATRKIQELELSEGYEGNQSWHHQFRSSAYIYVGGLNPGLTEGDVIIMFSQFGEIVDVNLVRDKTTGKSKGFAFVCYEDQRSTNLAVDNMNGYSLLKRTLRVDHVDKYKAPKHFDEEEKDEDGDPKLLEYKATGAEGRGYQEYNVIKSQQRISEVSAQRRELAAPAAPKDEDEAWAKAFEDSLRRGSEKECHKKSKSGQVRKKDKMDLKSMQKEAKRLKREAKKVMKRAKKEKQRAKGNKSKRVGGAGAGKRVSKGRASKRGAGSGGLGSAGDSSSSGSRSSGSSSSGSDST